MHYPLHEARRLIVRPAKENGCTELGGGNVDVIQAVEAELFGIVVKF